MSGHDDDRDLLTATLRDRAGDMAGRQVGLDQVKGRARGIRRRRRVVGGTAAAAVVLAIAVPVGLGLGDLTRTQQPMPAEPSPSVVETAAPEPAPTPRPDGTFPLTLDGLGVGPVPDVPYVLVDERTLVTANGSIDLPESFLQVTPFRDGWLALAERTTGAGGLEVRTMDQDFTVFSSVDSGPALAVSADRSRVAYTEQGRDTVLVSASTTENDETTWTIPDLGELQPLGYLDDETVVFQSTSGEDQYVGLAEPDGAVTQVDGFLNLADVNQPTGLVSGLTRWDVESSCSALADPRTGSQVFETCDFRLGPISPDGRYVVGYPTTYDGPGPSSVAVLDALTGDPVAEFRPGRARTVTGVSQSAWEDDDSLVVALTQGDRMGLVRADVDGRLETVTDTVRVPDLSVGLWFAEGPRF